MILRAIRFYQRWISPFFPPHCRFIPTCSAYAVEAIETHGALRGGRMALGRVCRCHPFHTSGYDPVPPATGAPAKASGNGSGEHQSQSGNPCLVNHPLDQVES